MLLRSLMMSLNTCHTFFYSFFFLLFLSRYLFFGIYLLINIPIFLHFNILFVNCSFCSNLLFLKKIQKYCPLKYVWCVQGYSIIWSIKEVSVTASTIVNIVIICIMLFYIKVTRSRLRSQIIFVLKLWPFP